jgi:hypothetical protein
MGKYCSQSKWQVKNALMTKIIKSIASFTISFMLSVSEVLATPQYLTKSEIITLRQQFRQLLKSSTSNPEQVIKDSRSLAERQARNSFVKSWGRIDPAIAPFLGRWQGYESSYHIYPSRHHQRVCILETGEGQGSFTTGTIVDRHIITEDNAVIFRADMYLGNAVISDRKPYLNPIIYGQPRVLEPLKSKIDGSMPDESFATKNSIRRRFEKSGCTSSLPN